MEMRKPRHNDAIRCVLKPLINVSQVGQDIPMGNHHPFGFGGGTRCILKIGERVAFQLRTLPVMRQTLREGVSFEPMERLKKWGLTKLIS